MKLPARSLLCLWLAMAATLPAFAGFRNFVKVKGDQLVEGSKPFRFISFNIPNLHYVEDDMTFDRPLPFRFPDSFEIDDALGGKGVLGGVAMDCTASSGAPKDSCRMAVAWSDPEGIALLGTTLIGEGAMPAKSIPQKAIARMVAQRMPANFSSPSTSARAYCVVL